ncbi:nuclear valosin-containing protein-like [Penaeus chinensis]|uniref:nuclear valosin-containing protein-like n=1 Tax=Penaeus chinensis TaxID=139456 RepID=UPI001FB57124|nr:nuclear valosin-containing protein-like [Penaeus chinensis]
MKMKRPYFQEKSLMPRVIKYMEENDSYTVMEMTDYLIKTYREFRGKSRMAFMNSVDKAYQWQKQRLKEKQEDSFDEEIEDSDGGGPDIIEVATPKQQAKPLKKKHAKKYPASPSTTSTPKSVSKMRDNDFFVIDTTGGDISLNGIRTPEVQKSVKVKRKKDKEMDVEGNKRKKRKQLQPEMPEITFAEMAGLELLKDKICDLLANLRWPGILQPLQKSVLVTGPTGSGKTTFVQALAGTAEVSLLRITATELIGGVSGESEEKITEVFEQAASLAPCVLLIEKIEVVAPKLMSAKSMEKRIGAQFSSCLNNLKVKHKDTKLLVLAETSYPENLDLDLRSSFDSEIFMNIPTEPARVRILQVMCDRISFEGNFEEIALRTPGYVAGDLKKLVEKSQGLAWKRRKDCLYGKTEGATLMEEVNSFLKQFGEMCESEAPDSMVTVNMEDFLEALLHIIPALKREGFPTVPDVTWRDIGGLEDIKKELREKILEPIKYAKLHEEFGASRPNGILMWGPPGCGKTLLAKAVANEAGINLLPVMGPELLNMYQGESERAVREVFTRARNVAPCVIFFDEFDSLCPVRSKGAESGSKTTIVNTLLTEMNGFSKREDVYVIAATNRPDILDPAVTRPGRFDTLLYVDVPDHEGRVSIFQARTKNGTCPRCAPDVDFAEISLLCNNFSGADCDQLVYLASKEAIREVIHGSQDISSADSGDKEPKTRLVAKRHFSAALKKIKPSIKPEEQKRYKKLNLKMGTAPLQESVGGTNQDTSFIDVDKESQPMDIGDKE